MSEPLEALRGYVHFLHEHEGIRDVRLSRTAREGLAKLVETRVPSRPTIQGRQETAVPTPTSIAPRIPTAKETIAEPPAAQRAAATVFPFDP